MLNRTLPWYLVLATTAVLGLWHSGRLTSARMPQWDSREASLKEMARTYLGDADALTPLGHALKQLPDGEEVLLLGGQSDARASETFLLVSYIAWPRKVWFISQGLPLDSRIKHQPPPPGTKPGALLFYRLTPPPQLAARARTIGSELSLVVTAEGPR